MRWKAVTAIWAVGFIALGAPLFEPAWSPVLILPGGKEPAVDNIKALLIADLDGDNVGKLLPFGLGALQEVQSGFAQQGLRRRG